jgi:Mg-chelatase subunit ChlD
MNEESPPPFDTVGDESVEARIVAWVLGETSAFEAAELERLCEERPELLVFRRRMRALHGLLTEAESAEKDHSWKLPAEKRKVLDEIFGEEKVTRLEPQREKSVRHSARRALLGIAACLVLTLIVAGLFASGGAGIQKARKVSDARHLEKKVDFMPEEKQKSALAVQELNKAVRDQEDKVEERRKVLSTIVRTKGVIYKGQDSFYGRTGVDEEVMKDDSREEAIKRGLDAQDYVDAKRDFEADQQLLQALKLKQIEQTIAKNVRDESFARNNAPAPTAAPSTPPSDGSFRLESNSKFVNRQLGMQKTKEQTMLAKSPAKPASRVAASAAPDQIQLPPPEESTMMDQLPAIAASGLGGGGGGLGAGAELDSDARGKDSSAPVSSSAASAPVDPSEPSTMSAGGARSRFAYRVDLDKESAPERQSGRGNKVGASGQAGHLGRGAAVTETEYGVTISGDKGDISSDSSSVLADKGAAVPAAPSQPSGHNSAYDGDLESSRRTPPEGAKAVAGALGLDSQAVSDSKPVDVFKSESAETKTRSGLLSSVDAAREPSRVVNGEVALAAKHMEKSSSDLYFSEYVPPAPADELLPEEEAESLADLANEIPAAETPYSTFSLNISDASFQLAKAALAKGERPDPAGIKPEQFYNAVDYGDPAPASNEPVAATIEQSAHPVIPGRNLVRVALRTGSVGRSAVQPLRLTLLVDQSGSMVREDRRAAMEHALAQLGVLLTKNDLVTVIGFSRTPRLLAEAKAADETLKLGELVNQTASEGGTNLEEAMKLAGQLATRHQLAGAQNRIVLFTDGAANLGDANPTRLAEQVKAFRQNGLAFDIAGIGADGLNDRLLSELARNGNGRYYVVGDEKDNSFARQLAGAFRPAAENVKVQVNFNPQRVGKYKLIGFEKDRLKTEDFRNDAVDAAELAAEEAGVAIYQVEPLADGTGEIGEVSVRFRDAASKEMVERTWTIPFESQATAFDRATPSMQLAGLSLLAAEKLKGGPLADAIDFKELTGPSASVKQFYGNSPRISEMLQVIEKLK